jgi:hypothetical protein
MVRSDPEDETRPQGFARADRPYLQLVLGALWGKRRAWPVGRNALRHKMLRAVRTMSSARSGDSMPKGQSEPNVETQRAIADGRARRGVTVHKSAAAWRKSIEAARARKVAPSGA